MDDEDIIQEIIEEGGDKFKVGNVAEAKIVLANGDVLKAQSDTASSLDIVTSFIDTISS